MISATLIDRIPGFRKAAQGLARALHQVVLKGGAPARKVADLLHGTWLGHPLHPLLTDVTLGADTLRALHAWFDSADVSGTRSLLRGSRQGGALTNTGMSERSITGRVRVLGEEVGLEGLSAYDCRHFWATYWARKVDVLRLQEAGGWSSLAMPRRYVEDSEIANEGMA